MADKKEGKPPEKETGKGEKGAKVEAAPEVKKVEQKPVAQTSTADLEKIIPREPRKKPIISALVFGRWDSDSVDVADPGLRRYINLDASCTFMSQGRHQKKKFGKGKVHIIERLVNNMMRGGTGEKISGRVIRDRGGCGKKTMMYKVAEKAFEMVNRKTGKNPVDVFIRAIENAAPREETTRVKYGGVLYHVAVDVSPMRRVDFALRNIARAMAIRSFDNKKSAEEALAEELLLASQNDSQSHAIARKIEIERVARSSR